MVVFYLISFLKQLIIGFMKGLIIVLEFKR